MKQLVTTILTGILLVALLLGMAQLLNFLNTL